MRRRLLALVALVAVAGAVAAVVASRDGGVPYDDLAACRRPRVAPAPAVAAGAAVPVAFTTVAPIEQAIGLAPLPGGAAALVATRTGQVWRLDLGTGAAEEVLDLGRRTVLGAEGGLLGVAVDPDGRFAYLHYTDREGASRLVEYALAGTGLDPASERELLRVDHAAGLHNGGAVHFGPDGALYVGFGNGGDRPSDAARVRDTGRLDGKLVRISPRPDGDQPYGIPGGNPSGGEGGARREIWAGGLRNPWQFSFDRATGDLWIGDVGSSCWEEVDVLGPGVAGADLGYPKVEGFHAFLDEEAPGATFPVHAYPHGSEGCAVIGGVVYRGARVPALQGAYLMADFCTDRVRWLRRSPAGVTVGDLEPALPRVQAFAQDLAGEVYLLSAERGVLRLDGP